MTKEYMIEIETPNGVVVKGEQHEQSAKKYAADVELPEGYVVTDAGVVEAPKQEVQYIEPLLEQKRQHMGQRAKRIIANSFIYAILIAMSLFWLLPFLFIVFESFRIEFPGPVGYIWPKKWGFDNYLSLFTNCIDAQGKFTGFPRWFLNTFIMGIAVSIIQTVMVLAMSYTLSRLRFRGRKGLMNFMLILGMFPGFLTMILLYELLRLVNLTGSNAVGGLILVYTASSGMGYYVSKGFFDTIPRSLDEAARVDGATRFQVFYKVILPMAKPIVIYTILMGFMAPWGDFVLAAYVSKYDPVGSNVAVGMQKWIGDEIHKNYTRFCAAGIVVSLPITLLFMFMQKYYVEGVTGGAVKG